MSRPAATCAWWSARTCSDREVHPWQSADVRECSETHPGLGGRGGSPEGMDNRVERQRSMAVLVNACCYRRMPLIFDAL